MPGPWNTSNDALRLMVDTYEGRKASWRSPLNVWLNKIQGDTNDLLLSTLWRSEIAHAAAQRSLGIRDGDDGGDDDDDEGLCRKWG